jgi:hypothetical protein
MELLKLSKVFSVAKSCKTPEQLASCIVWSGRVLSHEDSLYFNLLVTRNVPNVDLAVHIAKQEMLGRHG